MRRFLFSAVLFFSVAISLNGQVIDVPGDCCSRNDTTTISENGKQVIYLKKTYTWGVFYFKNGVQITKSAYLNATEADRKKKEVKNTVTEPKDSTAGH